MVSNEKLNHALTTLKELETDTTLPKNVKNKIATTIKLLEGKEEASIKASKALHEIEELADNMNTPSFIRTQLYNITSLLEGV